jgi:hypothetical protein
MDTTSGYMIAGGYSAVPAYEVWRNNTGAGAWTAATTSPAGNIEEFCRQSTFLYCACSTTGVYRSSNNGDTWTLRNAQTGYCITARASDGYLYMGSSNGVNRSNDGGLNWTNVFSYGYNVNSILVTSANTILAFTANGYIFRSTNGTTWSQVFAPFGSRTGYSLCQAGDYIFAANVDSGGTYLQRSDDDGQTWWQGSYIPAVVIYDMMYDSSLEVIVGCGLQIGSGNAVVITGQVWIFLFEISFSHIY